MLQSLEGTQACHICIQSNLQHPKSSTDRRGCAKATRLYWIQSNFAADEICQCDFEFWSCLTTAPFHPNLPMPSSTTVVVLIHGNLEPKFLRGDSSCWPLGCFAPPPCPRPPLLPLPSSRSPAHLYWLRPGSLG